MAVASTLPRTILPARVGQPELPAGLVNVGYSGKAQLRGGVSAGWKWTESWSVLTSGNASVEELLGFFDHYWNLSGTFNAQHLRLPGQGLGNNGSHSSGSCLVDGAGQTGTTLHVDGLDASESQAIRVGDWLQIGTRCHRVTSDAASDGSGDADVTIMPGILAAYADNATVTLTSGVFKVFIADYSRPVATPDGFYAGLSVTFQEALT